MLTRVHEGPSRTVSIVIDGTAAEASAGETVAAALLAAGHVATRRTAVTGSPRGGYCLMGICFECVVTIDGVPNRQGCLVEVQPGMRIETGLARAAVAS
jgi:predicted molibdopterin-dependent oxidoreductase YjgC